MSERKVALITGSSRGIGLGTAIALANKEFAIALNGPADDEELHEAAQTIASIGVPVVKVVGDVSVVSDHSALLDTAEQALGPLTTLVNNAGVSVLARGDLLDVSEESYDRCMAINAKAQFFLSQSFARRLLSRERDEDTFYSLINVSSVNAQAASVARGEYCASKAAASMIAKVFAVRLGAEGIAVYDIQPGLIDTDMTKTVKQMYEQRIAEEGATLIPRMGKPADVGKIIATLASGGMPYTTGHTIMADAGLILPRF